MSEEELRAERLKKLHALKAAGMEPYPAHTERDVTIADFLKEFDEREKRGATEILAGRVLSLRGQGGIVFADLFDGTARGQVVLQEAEVDTTSFTLFTETVDAGDFIEVSGVAFKTKRGEPSLKVREWKMLSKSLLPIPSQWFGIQDEELRLRERYLDFLLREDARERVKRRARFWQAMREFYLARGFLEVETPVLETSPGGADARPFATHHHALDIDVYLRISAGELWQKELLIAGFPKVFEIGRIFRNEGQSREHLQDYTQLESYEAYADAASGMAFVQELYRHVGKEVYGTYTFEIGDHTVDLAEEWGVIDFCAVLKEHFGVDPLSASEEELIAKAKEAGVEFGGAPNRARAADHLWKKVRKGIAGPVFLTGVPVFLEPLAKRAANNPQVVDRIQIILAGSEMGKGYSELNDPQDQRARFEEQQRLREEGDEEAQRLDLDYVRAMEYGMPPSFGFGVSERLFSFLEDVPAHEGQTFPLLRPKDADFR